MGGCRCTYRNCNVKSDGKTHMFHFPVFDKVRCHKWLVNAHRLDFLDLKVSQLKNRCICQHHFKTDNFMNYKKDKLTFDAVPTINGPFCDPSKFEGLGDIKEYPNTILVEDIENDFDIDKKSNFSVKYGDFLTNNEFVDSSSIYNRNNIIQTKDNVLSINLNPSANIKDQSKILPEPQNPSLLLLPLKQIKKEIPQPMMGIPPYSDLSNELKMGKELNLEQKLTVLDSNLILQGNNSNPENICVSSSAQAVDIAPQFSQDLSNALIIGKDLNLEKNLTDPFSNGTRRVHFQDKNSKPENISVISSIQLVDNASKSDQGLIKKRPKVKILSEKKIKSPINIRNIAGKFEKISPSHQLTLSDKKCILSKCRTEPEITPKTLIESDNNKPSEKLKALKILDLEFDPAMTKSDLVHNGQNNATADKMEKVLQSPPKKSLQIKNKITPERSAAIEKKRKFNMRLKDIIESCLDKLDDPLKNYEISPNPTNNLEKPPISRVNENIHSPVSRVNENIHSKKCKSNLPAEKVDSHLVEDKSLSSVKDHTIAYLEDRMKKMENTLLNKIAQNSQEIIEFKNTILKNSISPQGKKPKRQSDKRVASTQMNDNESCYKNFLYQEISKFLSPSANSVLYEELFIKKNSRAEVEMPSVKKRRRVI